jgi:hypothetical protein
MMPLNRLAPFAVIVLVPAAAAQPSAETINVSASACAAVAHENDAPGVAYAPGVDAEGNPVAPADLPGGGNPALNDKLASAPVKITVDLQKRFGIPANANLFHGRSEIGYVTVKDGKAYLDGVPLSGTEEALLGAACAGKAK